MTHRPSYGPAREVLAAIDAAERIRARNPTLFSAQVHAKGNDRDVRQLVAAAAKLKARSVPSKSRPDRDEVERVDRTWEEHEARSREEHDQGRRLRLNTQARERRRRLTGLQLVRQVIDEIQTISTVPAGNIEPSRGDSTHGGVPAQQTLDQDPRWQFAERIIHQQAMHLLALVDEAKGFSPAGAAAQMSAEEKDRMLVDGGVGKTAAKLYVDTEGMYGSETYIRRLRTREGLDSRGYPKVDR